MHISSTFFLTTLAVASVANGASGPDRTGVVDSTDPIASNIFEPSLFEQAPAEETLEKRVAALEKRLAERDPKGGLAKHPASERKGTKEHKHKSEHETKENKVELEARAVRKTGSRVNPTDATGPINALRAQHNLTSIVWNVKLANAAQT
ncbi:hypothetical protein RQP46_006307 [Phenoliferia psychrophenolica]